MKQNLTLTITSLLTLVLTSFHFTHDILHDADGLAASETSIMLAIVLVMLWGTIELAGRRTGYVIMLLGHLAADGLDPLQVGDGGLKEAWVVDAPGGAVGPIDADAIAHLAAEPLIAGHTERLGLGIEERIRDGTDGLRRHPAGARSRSAVKLRVDALVLAGALADDDGGQALDHGADAWRAKPFIELAPADDAAVGAQFQHGGRRRRLCP